MKQIIISGTENNKAPKKIPRQHNSGKLGKFCRREICKICNVGSKVNERKLKYFEPERKLSFADTILLDILNDEK